MQKNYFRALTCLLLLSLSPVFQGVASAATALAPNPVPAPEREFYFKAPVYKLADGTPAVYPADLHQMTDMYLASLPQIQGIPVVQVGVYWSQLCPTSAQSCDLTLIDQILIYWQAHGKKVNLGVITESNPTKTVVNGQVIFVQATPNWVMSQIQTFKDFVTVGGQEKAGSSTGYPMQEAAFPINWGPNYVSLVNGLIDWLAERYDGNPTLSHLSMTYGFNGEDLADLNMPGLNPQNWVKNYEWPVMGHYFQKFKKTKLEYDMAIIAYLRQLAMAHRDGVSAQMLDDFILILIKHPVMLSMQGLRSDSLPSLDMVTLPWDAHKIAFHYLQSAQERGDEINIEAYTPLQSPSMADQASIVQTLVQMHPDRIVFFNPAVNVSQTQTAQMLQRLEASPLFAGTTFGLPLTIQ